MPWVHVSGKVYDMWASDRDGASTKILTRGSIREIPANSKARNNGKIKVIFDLSGTVFLEEMGFRWSE
jgi:hypothetical protein